MSIYEYNEEYAKKSAFEEGKSVGEAIGEERGEERGKAIGEALGKAQTLIRTVDNAMLHFHVDLEQACEGLGSTPEDYKKAKELLQVRNSQIID